MHFYILYTKMQYISDFTDKKISNKKNIYAFFAETSEEDSELVDKLVKLMYFF